MVIETVTVGNPGNVGDPIQFQGVFGAVDYVYAIGKFEVTAGQYNDLIDPDPGHNATFRGSAGDFTMGPPFYRTEVGAHENSASAYGTFDQGGNVQEFNETVPESDIRGIRGGSWFWGDVLYKWHRPVDMHSSDQFSDLGFRVRWSGSFGSGERNDSAEVTRQRRRCVDAALSVEVQLHAGDLGQDDRQAGGPP